jgi:hypothetical protein
MKTGETLIFANFPEGMGWGAAGACFALSAKGGDPSHDEEDSSLRGENEND